MYVLRFLDSFKSTYDALIKGNQEKEKRAKKALNLLRQAPLYPSLKSHKVNTKSFGERWSSWITGNLRIIWDYDPEEKMRIMLFAIVPHTGTHKEYK